MATYLITQATGCQAQATITHLLAAGAKVHAVVRNPQKIPEVLKSPGVTVFKGESVNFEDVFRAAQGCKGVFLNTFPIPGLEAQQAKTIVEAAKKAGIKTIVANTTMGTGRRDMWDDAVTEECFLRDYYRSKAGVEDTVRAAGFEAYTILRPAFIHVDYMLPNARENFPKLATNGELDHFYNDGARMVQTVADDIGKYAAAALENPAKFGGHEIELASENLTIEEIRDILVKVSGRDVQTKRYDLKEFENGRPSAFGQYFHLWANVKNFDGVVKAAKEAEAKFGIPFTPLETALRKDKDRLLECLPVKA
ncbi:NmrA-like family protein [Xylariaceae sp. FL1651]|nr:NmrA-like family protein [Xylariaceae sp. FL1651]